MKFSLQTPMNSIWGGKQGIVFPGTWSLCLMTSQVPRRVPGCVLWNKHAGKITKKLLDKKNFLYWTNVLLCCYFLGVFFLIDWLILCACVCVRVCVCMCMYVYVCVYVCVCEFSLNIFYSTEADLGGYADIEFPLSTLCGFNLNIFNSKETDWAT